MTVRERVKHTQYVLAFVSVASSLAWAATAWFAVSAIGGNRVVAALVAQMALLAALWLRRRVLSLERVSLWIEERAPQLRYVLVTAVDPRHSAMLDAAAQQFVKRVSLGAHLRGAAARTLGPGMLALAGAITAFAVLPRRVAMMPPATSSSTGGSIVPRNRLQPLVAEVVPPAYARMRTVRIDEPAVIRAWRGSRVVFRGRDGWSESELVRDTVPAAVRLQDRGYSRSVILDPRVDQAPTVNLLIPALDSTLRTPQGTLRLVAELADDIGLARARFEWIISSGSEERFEFREGVIAPRSFHSRAMQSRMEASVTFESLGLKEGDRLSLRAVAWDGNTLYGPGKGVSETRTIRVATRGEHDNVSVNRAPPSADTAMLSLRMLIVETERLQAQRNRMDRGAFAAEARRLGGQSETIRRRIQQIIEETTSGGQVEPDTLLTTAATAMWEATRELYIAAPQEALPPMYVAYRALQALRSSSRYYIRGLQRPIIVDVDRIRLAGGTDTGRATPRSARASERSPTEALQRTYAEAIRLLSDTLGGDSALVKLMDLRVASLRLAPDVAKAVAEAIGALQTGADATPPLVRARRLLAKPPVRLDSLPLWGGGWQ